MATNHRIYMDHAATSWPKSEAVLSAMTDFIRNCGSAAGRGGYRSAVEADRLISLVRRQLAAFIESPSSDCISFHSNGTAALNTAIYGLVGPGDHVVVSAAEHNSVLRPLHELAQRSGVRLSIVPVSVGGAVEVDHFLEAIEPETRLAVLTHASNVTGVMQPVAEIGKSLRSTQTALLCDAAQTFGSVPISVSELGVDLLAAPGHKCSGGPLGTALLYVSPELHEQIRPSVYGGTGSQSESLEMPLSMPQKLEPGNLNVPAICGWGVALTELGDLGTRQQHSLSLSRKLHEGLRGISSLSVHGSEGSLPIASVTMEGLDPADLAAILDSEFGVEARAGFHCAALIHEYLGTESKGTLRLSAGHGTQIAEVEMVIRAVSEVVEELGRS